MCACVCVRVGGGVGLFSFVKPHPDDEVLKRDLAAARAEAWEQQDRHEESMEHVYKVDLEAHEANDILEDIIAKRKAAGLPPKFDEPALEELSDRFLARREERKPQLKQRHARRRARHYKQKMDQAHRHVYAAAHHHMHKLDTETLKKVAEHTQAHHEERHTALKAQRDAHPEGKDELHLHKEQHAAKLAELLVPRASGFISSELFCVRWRGCVSCSVCVCIFSPRALAVLSTLALSSVRW
jgi:hypothetical protein